MGFQMTYEMRFITIGYIEWRKGQDLLVDVIEQLPADIADAAEFVLAGQNTSLMAQKLADRITVLPNVTMLGKVSREEVHGLLDSADILICPSREDPMPTVCAEAMMHGVPCLVSNAVGTAAYIMDLYNGLVFESENISDLKEKIIWCVSHSDEIKEMGNRAYEIYKKNFSTETFEQNLLMYVEEMIGKAGCCKDG